MTVLLQKGPEQLQQWVAELSARMLDPAIQHVTPPLAAVCLDRPPEAFTALVAAGAPPRDDQDVLALFSLARAGIRIAHVISSPWYFTFTREVARRARWAARWQASRGKMAPPAVAKARTDFAALSATLLDVSEGFSVHEILETHAIVDGLRASMARPTPLALYHLMRELYRESPGSRRLLSHMIDQFGVDVAVPLAPRLCAAALKFPFPSIALADLLRSTAQRKNRTADLLAMDSERFFAACTLDVARVSRSTRELRVERRTAREADRRTTQRDTSMAERRSTAPVDGQTQRLPDQPLLESLGWGDTMRMYFDSYETLPGVAEKLDAAVHPTQAVRLDDAKAGPLFRPAWALFADGRAADLRATPGDLAHFARWVTTALEMLDGLVWLQQPAGAAP